MTPRCVCMCVCVTIGQYSMGVEFKSAGVVSGGDMTTESCTTKLAYLIGALSSADAVERSLSTNIRGEISLPSSSPKRKRMVSSATSFSHFPVTTSADDADSVMSLSPMTSSPSR